MAAQSPAVLKKSRRRVVTPESLSLPPTIHHQSNGSELAGSPPNQNGDGFDPRFLMTKLGSGKSSQEYRTNEAVFSQGDAANAVFYIQTGKVKLTVVSKAGKEAVIAILPEDCFFGEGCLAGQPVRMSTASALQRSTVVRVEKSIMIDLLPRESDFARQFLTHLLSRNIRMEADLVD